MNLHIPFYIPSIFILGINIFRNETIPDAAKEE